jgi:hypothetical protein
MALLPAAPSRQLGTLTFVVVEMRLQQNSVRRELRSMFLTLVGLAKTGTSYYVQRSNSVRRQLRILFSTLVVPTDR